MPVERSSDVVPGGKGVGSLISLEEATAAVLAASHPLDTENVALAAALRRIVATEVTSRQAVPPFDNSAMDGFAIRSADTAGAGLEVPAALRLVDESRAGRPAQPEVRGGQAVRISTGAVLPPGADAVVPIEEAVEAGDGIEVPLEVSPGRYVRRAGDDVRTGQLLVEGGTRLGPAELGVLASVGIESLPCHRRPSLALVVCGDELAKPGGPLAPGQIHDSSSRSVAAQAELAGADVRSSRVVGDEFSELLGALRDGLEADILVVCGGVSVGAHDHTKRALDELGVERSFWGLALRPGRPTWFGTHGNAGPEALVFGLPGNPVSAMVTFALLVAPALRRLSGQEALADRVEATIAVDYPHEPGRLEAVRCLLEAGDGGWRVRPNGAQGSHVLTSMLGAQALALIEADRGEVKAGERVTIELLQR